MFKLVLVAVVAVLTAAPAVAADETAVMSVVRAWVTGFNRGDTKAATATCATEAAIIDDFAPHEWHGAGACSRWFSDFQAMSKSEGITDPAITIGKPSHVDVSAKVAYVVTPVTLKFHLKGTPVTDHGILTVTLKNDEAVWRITGWVWSDQ